MDRIHECPEDVTDVAIVSSERIYVLYDNLLAIGQFTKVRDWHVWQWEYDIDTGLKSGSTLLFHGNSYIFAGDDGEEGRSPSRPTAESHSRCCRRCRWSAACI